jgi:hypothetical protein
MNASGVGSCEAVRLRFSESFFPFSWKKIHVDFITASTGLDTIEKQGSGIRTGGSKDFVVHVCCTE